MIRNHHSMDMDRIIEIYTEVYNAMPDEIETLRTSKSILIYEDSEILGFAHYIFNDSECYLEIGVDSKCDIVDIGISLWNRLCIEMDKNNIKHITTFHVQEDERWRQLFDQLGFEYKYSVNRLIHETEVNPSIELTVCDYTDAFFEEKIQLECEAFEPVRKENNIMPYNWYSNASERAIAKLKEITLGNAAYIKVYKTNNEVVGVSQVKDREVELIFTVKALQGKGYGSQILRDSIARGQRQGNGEVFLNVLTQNEKALKLYYDHQFRKIQSQDCRSKVYQA